VTILAGQDDDPVVVRIHHAELPEVTVPKPTDAGVSLEEMNRSLPQGWEVFKTSEGRLLYVNESLDVTTWDHPAPPRTQFLSLSRPQ
jgi:hypothetical protein